MKEQESYDVRFSNALKKEHSKVFSPEKRSFRDDFVDEIGKCPVCGEAKYSVFCVKDSFVHKRCTNCGFVYVDPRLNFNATISFYNSDVNEIYNESKFHEVVDNAPDDLENLKNYKLLRQHLPGDVKGMKLLEIGPGKGTFLAKAANDGFEVHAIELNTLLIEKLKKITEYIYTKDILELDLPEDYFDVIYFRDVMEHIPNAIEFLTKVQLLLRKGGIVFIDTHNIDSIVNLATKDFHTVIFAFEHPVHWSPKTLTLAGEKAGLKIQKVYFDHGYQSVFHIVNYLLHPSFTYIYPPRRKKAATFFLKAAFKILNLRYVRALDSRLMNSLSRLLKKGSKMQVVFTK
jgi:2-polyprenyl-3-methyl-5-hydroxy-6-metoxy-1,4-benzoquinol methylase